MNILKYKPEHLTDRPTTVLLFEAFTRWRLLLVKMNYSQLAPAQLAHPTNSPHYHLAPSNSPHFSYKLALRFCQLVPLQGPSRQGI